MQARNPTTQSQWGLTLIELIFTIAVMGILAAVAIPSYSNYLAKQKVKSAAQSLSQDLRFGREEAVRLGRSVHLSHQSGPAWCWGLNFNHPCDCGSQDPAARCEVSQGRESDFKGVTLQRSEPAEFDKTQGRSLTPAVTEFASSGGHRLRVELNTSGRARVCVPAGGSSVAGIEGC